MSQNRGRFSRRGFLLGAACLPILAQDEATFSTGIEVTNIIATVRNKQGHLIENLAKDDFSLEEDGRPQEIRYFSAHSDLPLTIGILVDVSGSVTNVLHEESRATFQFLDQVIREGTDHAFVFRFYRRAEMLGHLTGSRPEMRAALIHVTDPKVGPDGTALNDAVKLAADSIMRKQQGRKALILLSDGDDTGSSTSLTNAIEAAQAADTLVYSLGFYAGGGFGGAGGRLSGKDVMKRLAKETGGNYFEISAGSAAKVFRQVENELRNQYSLGYQSDGAGTGFRKVHVSVTRNDRKDLMVQARAGYWTQQR